MYVMLFITVCFVIFVCLTAAGFALLVAVDEEVTGALGAERQQDALQHCRQHSETQQEGPQGGIPHDGLNPKDLYSTHTMHCLHTYNTVQYIESYICHKQGHQIKFQASAST